MRIIIFYFILLEMIDLEAALDKMDQEIREINSNADVIIRKQNQSTTSYINDKIYVFLYRR